jgi:Ca2+-binding EF-hand superfamily protein
MSFALMSKKGREERHMKELRDAFDAADKDKDGKLSPHEWLQVLKITGVDANWDDVQQLFREKDRDFDGYLSFEEFTGQETKIEMAFKAMDKDGDGSISKEEFKKVCKSLTSEQATAAFNKFDKEGTGKLNYREFCTLMHSRKEKKRKKSEQETANNTPNASTSKSAEPQKN